MKEFLPCRHSPQLGMEGSWVQLLLEGPILQAVLRLGCGFAGPWEITTGEKLSGLLDEVTEVTQGPCGLSSPNQDSQ